MGEAKRRIKTERRNCHGLLARKRCRQEFDARPGQTHCPACVEHNREIRGFWGTTRHVHRKRHYTGRDLTPELLAEYRERSLNYREEQWNVK